MNNRWITYTPHDNPPEVLWQVALWPLPHHGLGISIIRPTRENMPLWLHASIAVGISGATLCLGIFTAGIAMRTHVGA